MFENVSLSELTLLDKRLSLFRQLSSRISHLEFHYKVTKGFKIISGEISSTPAVQYYKEYADLRSMLVQLDKNSLIPHTDPITPIVVDDKYPELRRAFIKLGTIEEQCKRIFGVYLKPSNKNLNSFELEFLSNLKDKGSYARTVEMRYRIEQELIERTNQGWFVIFQTLTVRDGCQKEVFSKGSKAFYNYIRNFDRSVGRTIYCSVRKADLAVRLGDKYHTYFAVVERGTKGTQRLHIHVLHLVKKLPRGTSRDPNSGLRVPYRRQLNGMGNYWSYGNTTPIAVRLKANDSFTKIGWVWPVELDENTNRYSPVEAKPESALAAYVSKYVTKAYLLDRKDYFRCRMTRNFGLAKINQMIRSLEDETLVEMMSIRDTTMFRNKNKTPPPLKLVRKEAMKEVLSRMKKAKGFHKLWPEISGLQPQKNIVNRLRDMTSKTTMMSNKRNCGSITTQSMTNLEIFSDVDNNWKYDEKVTRTVPAGPYVGTRRYNN